MIEERVGKILNSSSVNKIIVGVSGGADSVALLRVLHSLNVEILAVHCNFGLRGEESDRDQNFVEGLCTALGVDLDIIRFNVEEYMRSRGVSLEMACRELRYDYFRNMLKVKGYDRIAVAHNSDDNAETVLLNLFRGSGISGLRAMKQDTGEIIRPLLSITRKEIENYLSELKQPYIIDSSNLSSDFRRNFIRNEVLPMIETRWPRVKNSLNKTASIMAEEEEGIDSVVAPLLSSTFLDYETLHSPVKGEWLLRRFVTGKGGSDYIVGEIGRMVKSGDVRIGAKWKTPAGDFIFTRTGLEWVETGDENVVVDFNGLFEWTRYENTPDMLDEIRKERTNTVLWINIDPENLLFRHPKRDDRIRPIGMRGKRKVADVIRECASSEKERRNAIIAEDKITGDVLWIEGMKRSGEHLITNADKSIWKVERKKNKNLKKLGK